MRPIHEHEIRHFSAKNNNSPPEPTWLVLGELAIIPLCFNAMIAVWGLVFGAVPGWMWAGLALYGGGGAWAAARDLASPSAAPDDRSLK